MSINFLKYRTWQELLVIKLKVQRPDKHKSKSYGIQICNLSLIFCGTLIFENKTQENVS